MFRLIFVAMIAAAAPATAEIIESYYAEIGPEDRRNSRGVGLSDPGAILQQDRANYHRFGIRHSGDEGDVFFANRDLRAQIPGLYARGRRDAWSDGVLTGNFNVGIIVFICGGRSQPTHLNVEPADGDGYFGC
ncbi:hypothetical protein ACK8OR_04760 [Jannaschia sp. KMU-145]|uniref:hypothetical protein n=1 Tax=Jannaschia halovivens TaxID=3388667 RepID=UPI00396B40D0